MITEPVTTSKEKIETHPCVQAMRQFPNQYSHYTQKFIRFRVLLDHNITEFRDRYYMELTDMTQQAETLANSLLETIEQWKAYIPEHHQFWMLAHRWLHNISMLIISLKHYPTVLISRKDYWLAEEEEEIRQKIDILLFSYRMLSPWLAEWKRGEPQIFSLTPEKPTESPD